MPKLRLETYNHYSKPILNPFYPHNTFFVCKFGDPIFGKKTHHDCLREYIFYRCFVPIWQWAIFLLYHVIEPTCQPDIWNGIQFDTRPENLDEQNLTPEIRDQRLYDTGKK